MFSDMPIQFLHYLSHLAFDKDIRVGRDALILGKIRQQLIL